MKVIKKPRLEWILGIGLILVVLSVVLGFLYHGSEKLPDDRGGMNVISRIEDRMLQGGDLAISEAETNYLLDMLIGRNKQRAGLMLRGVYVKLQENSTRLYVPFKIGSIGLMLSGGIVESYGNDFIHLRVKNARIGLLPVPRSLVLHLVAGLQGDQFKVSQKENTLALHRSLLPFGLHSIQAAGNRLKIGIDKLKDEDLMADTEQSQTQTQTTGNDTLKQKLQSGLLKKVIAANTNAKQSVRGTKASDAKDQTKILKAACIQLDRANGAVSNPSEHRVIEMAKTALSKMIADPKYNYQKDLNAAKAIYDKMTAREKENLRAAILGNLDTQGLIGVYNQTNGK